MRTARIVLKLVLSFAVSVAANAQQTPQRDMQALAVLQRSIAALGGATATAQVTDTVVTGSIAPSPGSSIKGGTFTWKTTASDFKYEFQTNSSNHVLVSGHGHPANARNGTTTTLSTHIALANPPLHLPVLVLADVLANQGYTVTLLGKATVNGAPAIKVHISLDTDMLSALVTPQDWYFDALSGTPLRVEHRLPDNRRPENYVLAAEEFSDFRVVTGLLVPFKITSYEEGTLVSVETVSGVQFNTGLSPTEFDAPVGGVQ